MKKVAFKFKNRQTVDEALGYILPRLGGGSALTVRNESEIVIESYQDRIDEMRELVKEFVERKKLDALTVKVISTLTSTIKEDKNRTIRLMNGDLVRLSPANAKSLVFIHDELSEENQAALRMMIIENKQSHEAAIQFCLEKTKETE